MVQERREYLLDISKYFKAYKIKVSTDEIFYESIAFKKTKDLPSNSNEEDSPMFEEQASNE